MEFKQLHTFLVIASLESFNKAADVLDLAQSTVSDQIGALENDLNVRLFNRERRRISLTTAGEILLNYARNMMDLESELRTEIKGNDKIQGSLSIRIPETMSIYFLPSVLHEFNRSFPLVDLSCHGCSYFGLAEELRSGVMNLAFLITDSFRAPDLETMVLRPVPLVLVSGPDHRLAGRGEIEPEDLKLEPVFAPTSDCDYFKILDRKMMEVTVRLRSIFRVGSLEAIKRNLMAGTGVALLTRVSVEKELAGGQLAELALSGGMMNADMTMIWQKDKWRSPALHAFMDSIIKSMSTSERVNSTEIAEAGFRAANRR
jgi:DNA-binding transcriptional LysR family regulator